MRTSMERAVWELVTGPDEEPVTLAEMKRALKETNAVTARDADVTSLITASREWLEDYTKHCMFDQTWRLTISGPQGYIAGDSVSGYRGVPARWFGEDASCWLRYGRIELNRTPILAVTSFYTIDSEGTTYEVDPAAYGLRGADSKWPHMVRIDGTAWPVGELNVVFRAGYADRTGSPQQGAERVPERFKQAMKLWSMAHFNVDPTVMQKYIDAAQALVDNDCLERYSI